MNQEQLRQIQKVQLTIMDDIHRVCVEHGLKYYMIGGTALGSIRHKGFIPWDVDIDIAMPREDYEKFVTVYSNDLKTQFGCHDYRTDKKHFSPHAIVALNGSKVIFPTTELNPHPTYGGYGLYVDILPLDSVPDDASLRNIHKKKLSNIEYLRNLKMCMIYQYNSWLTRKVKMLVSKLLPVSLYWINSRQQEIAQMFNHLSEDETHDICSTLSHYKYEKLCMPDIVWGTPTLSEFEGRMYYAQEQVTEYLRLLFGDYMKLPSVEHQRECMNLLIRVEWQDELGHHIVEG